MACSTVSTKNIDFEDLFIEKNSTFTASLKGHLPIYKKMLLDLIEWIETYNDEPSKMRKSFNLFYSKTSNKYKIYSKKNILIFIYRTMIENQEIENNPIVWKLLQKRPARNLSGVTIITVLTSPYPDGQDFSCKHNCYYCPNEPGQPRSYLKKEPAVARANRNDFDPILQMEDRLNQLLMNGHEIDKLEIIIEGGTYTEYPPAYLERFHRDLIYCANTYFDDKQIMDIDKIRREKQEKQEHKQEHKQEQHHEHPHTPATSRRPPLSIEEEIKLNATAKVRIIGICIETRPDALDATWLRRFRNWGVTRVQLGVQHTNNTILKKINRGHTIEQAIQGIKYLKDNCFKVDIHLMPDLPFSSPEEDMKMFDRVFKTPDLQPDQAKIYPCEVTPWTVIKQWHDWGKYEPYAQKDERSLLDVVKYGMMICPPWVRLPRVIRDIPLSYIEGGNKYPNLRQMLNDELEREGKQSMDIRVRECGRNEGYTIANDSIYRIRKYEASEGTEFFIALESKDEKCLYGFIRLRINGNENSNENSNENRSENKSENKSESPETNNGLVFEVLRNKGLIRELHVYGNLVPVGFSKNQDTQHRGTGKKLLNIAERVAYDMGCDGVAVISGIGVVKYYEKNGYHMEDTFMVKNFDNIVDISDIQVDSMINQGSVAGSELGYKYNYKTYIFIYLILALLAFLTFNISIF
jgi:ELP3 family radical SAM enzyme/protein acetyltransferase